MYVVEYAKVRMFVVEGEMVYSQKESPNCFLFVLLLSYVHLEEQVLSPVSQDLSKGRPRALWTPQLSISVNP